MVITIRRRTFVLYDIHEKFFTMKISRYTVMYK